MNSKPKCTCDNYCGEDPGVFSGATAPCDYMRENIANRLLREYDVRVTQSVIAELRESKDPLRAKKADSLERLLK